MPWTANDRSFLDPAVVARLGTLELKARTIVEGFLSGLHRSPFKGFSVEFAEYRQYIPGDDISTIDWKVYARSDRYYIKKFEEETNLDCHLLLDVSGSMAYGSHHGISKFEYGAVLAASLAASPVSFHSNLHSELNEPVVRLSVTSPALTLTATGCLAVFWA